MNESPSKSAHELTNELWIQFDAPSKGSRFGYWNSPAAQIRKSLSYSPSSVSIEKPSEVLLTLETSTPSLIGRSKRLARASKYEAYSLNVGCSVCNVKAGDVYGVI